MPHGTGGGARASFAVRPGGLPAWDVARAGARGTGFVPYHSEGGWVVISIATVGAGRAGGGLRRRWSGGGINGEGQGKDAETAVQQYKESDMALRQHYCEVEDYS